MSILDLDTDELKELRRLEKMAHAGKLSEDGERRYRGLLKRALPETSAGERALIGVGRGMLDIGQGAKQLAMNAGEGLGLLDEGAAQSYTDEVNRELAVYDQLSEAYPYSTGAGRIAGNVAAAPVGGVGAGATRLVSGAALGALAGGLEFSPENSVGERVQGAAFGGAGGLAGEAVGMGARAGYNRLTGFPEGSPRPPMRAPAGPEDVPARSVPPEVEFVPEPEGPIPPSYYWNEEFGIPYTRGQWNRDIPTQMDEQRAARGALGPGAEEEMRNFWDFQRSRADQAYLGTVDRMSRGAPGTGLVPENYEFAPGVLPEQEAGRALHQRLSNRAQGAWDEMSGAYEAAKNIGGEISIEDAAAVLDRVANSLDIVDIQTPEVNPLTHTALQRLREYLSSAPEGADLMSVQGLNNVRRSLTALMNKNPDRAEMRNLTILKKELDDAMGDLLEGNRIFGDPEGLEQIRRGIKLRADYGKLYGPRDRQFRSGRRQKDAAGQVIEKIIEDDKLSGKQIADLVLGRGQLGSNQNTLEVLKRVEASGGRDSAEFQLLKTMSLMRFREFIRTAGEDTISPAKFSSQWRNISNRNPELLAELFEPEELSELDRIAEAIGKTGYDKEALNPSGSAHMIERMMMSGAGGGLARAGTIGAMGGIGATTAGDLVGPGAGAAGGAAVGATLWEQGIAPFADAFRSYVGRRFGRRIYAPEVSRLEPRWGAGSTGSALARDEAEK